MKNGSRAGVQVAWRRPRRALSGRPAQVGRPLSPRVGTLPGAPHAMDGPTSRRLRARSSWWGLPIGAITPEARREALLDKELEMIRIDRRSWIAVACVAL